MLGVVLLLLLIAKGVDKQKLLNRNLLLLLQIYFDFLNLSSTPTLQAIGKPFRANSCFHLEPIWLAQVAVSLWSMSGYLQPVPM